MSISWTFIMSGGYGECFGNDGVDHLASVIVTLTESDRSADGRYGIILFLLNSLA
ncbi:hypothetical protein [Dolichospermum sp. LEGE 00246]|uniref:hypothetical protein n=1 Tax=Dolichospermum sp. LEGE 00246 TaxID=1828605 RepID=UPI001880938F|nr:hypothetical protein [Dolichospermum sp. LEGE 00246]